MGTIKPIAAEEAQATPETDLESVVEADTLVEEISIDGMCGVY
ncbi:MAG TPA: mycofactocin precursor MftA [Arthrobacter sp.]|nr:mycofactocin precursor MftA [Arthrobacter sp.]